MIKHSTKWGGGGYEAYPQLVHTLDKNKVAKTGARTHKTSAKRTLNGIKIKYRYQSTTVQIMLWLLAFCVSAVFAICPLARHATRYNLSATTIKLDTFYINAPAYIAGDTSRGADGAVNGSSISAENGTLLNTGTIPALFKAGGSVNTRVLKDLLTMIDSCSTTANATGEVTYYSAKSFGAYDPTGSAQSGWDSTKKGNAQILVKLFETTNNSTNTDLNDFTSQYWQAVYRSINGENDVLTLYMVRPYTNAQFNPDSEPGETYNSETYYNDGNYSQSYLRDKTVIPMYNALNTGDYFATQLNNYVVTPANLPGLWQSSEYQTSYNSSGDLYSTTGKGASGSGPNSNYHEINNGLDGKSTGPSGWESKIESAYTDKLWVPSAYEVLHTGYGSTSTREVQGTGRNYDEYNSIVYLSNYSIAGTGKSNSNENSGRTGLWELNGFDRAGSSWTWLRSGCSGNRCSASVIGSSGKSDFNGVYFNYGVRVALHLDLTALKGMLNAEITLDITMDEAERASMIYILDEHDNLKQNFVISETAPKTFTIKCNKRFTILVYETLYQIATIDGERTPKKVYEEGVSDDQTITITISSASRDVNNWVIV